MPTENPGAYSEQRHKHDYSQLRRSVKGAVSDDPISRALYASSASIVEVWPSCIVEPEDSDDVAETLRFANLHKIPVTCRGAGSGVAGQSLGQGLILDFSVHMNAVLETYPDLSSSWARVQPGVVKDVFDAELGSLGMFWPPDPSSSAWCTVGAMVANNSGGAKSIRWGTAKDYLLELDVMLMDGERIKLRPLPVSADGRIQFPNDATDREKALAIDTLDLVQTNFDLLKRSCPESTRSASGYNLFELLHEDLAQADYQARAPRPRLARQIGAGKAGVLDMPRLFSGSEGTLGVLLEARLRVLNLPKQKAGITLHFESNQKMAEAVVRLLETSPTKLEVLDRSILDVAAQSDPEVAKSIPERLVSMLIVEYWGASEEQVHAGVRAADEACKGIAFGAIPALDAADLQVAWRVREIASPILSRVKGDIKPTRWIEDCAVPPWKLPEFISRFKAICEKNGFQAHLFGHGGEGNLHVNPFVNPKDPAARARMRKAADEVYAMVKSLNGTISGEHGDGIMRTPYLREFYGEVYPLFERVKSIFDPKHLLNPLCKIIPKDSKRTITSFLRVGEGYQRVATGTGLDRPEILDEIEKCHGCGKCRTYCPLMRVGAEEKYSARAKANLLRAVISGRLDINFLVDAEFKANLDLCISCEQCLTDCPTHVDIPGIAIAFREQYVDRIGKGGVVADLLSRPDLMGKVGVRAAGLTNRILSNRFLRGVAQAVTGLDERRKLPKFAKPSGLAGLAPLDVSDEVRKLLPAEAVVFPGCYAEYYDPDGEKQTLVEILTALGVKVHRPALRCCGISKITQGDSRGARQDILDNADKLIEPVRRGASVIFSAPSCLLAAQREWPRIVGGEKVHQVSEACIDAHELLLGVFSHESMRPQLGSLSEKIAYHQPCHSKVLGVGAAPRRLMELLNERTTDLDAGCCGLSGTFGLRTESFDMSMKIGLPLFNRINTTRPDVVTTPCGICQTQIRQGVKTSDDGQNGVRVVHPLRLLYQSLANSNA